MHFRDDPIPTRAPAWRWPLAYVLTLLVFLALDGVWLSLSASALYRPAIGHLMAADFDWRAVAVFYPLYVGGLVFFAVAPALASRPFAGALGRGALFGFLAYATYDFTNQATLRDWPWHITVIDLVWGATVSGVSAAAASALTAVTCRRATRTIGR
nr:DUF2177 family protein [uncultured Roseateles sp.]